MCFSSKAAAQANRSSIVDRIVEAVNKAPEQNARTESEEVKEPLAGVGDAVSRIAEKLGIRECSKCKSRRARLNALFPFKNKR